MDQTPNLKLPYILPSQAQKHVTHNEALRLLDAVVHLSVRSRSRTDAPETPAGGDRYLVAAPALGNWAGKEGMIASFIDGGWLFVAPAVGWQVYVEDEAQLLVFDGALWKGVSSVPYNLSLSMLGVQATADAVNRLAVSSDASLFNNAGAGHLVKVNKQAMRAFSTRRTGPVLQGRDMREPRDGTRSQFGQKMFVKRLKRQLI